MSICEYKTGRKIEFYDYMVDFGLNTMKVSKNCVTRTINTLFRNNIETWNQLYNLTPVDLKKMRKLGICGYDLVFGVLNQYFIVEHNKQLKCSVQEYISWRR